MAVSETADAPAGLGQPAAQGADDRRRLQDPPERVRRHLDLEDPLPRGPEAAHPAPHLGRLPPLQPVRRRTAADDPAPAARRVPAAAGDPPGAGRRRRHRPRRRRRARAGRRRGAAGDPGQHLERLPDPRRGDRGDRRPRGADRRARELRHRPAREARRQDRLRRDRPRDRPRRQRTLPGRRRRPQPARLPLLGRPRGQPARSAARALAALAQPRAPQGGAARAWRAWRRRSATSSTCCWSATCAAWRATEPPRAMPRVTRRRTIAAPSARSGRWSPTPTACRAGGRARAGSRTSTRKSGGRRSQWTKVLETAEGRGVRADYRCLSSAEGERYVWEQQLEGTPFDATCAARRSRSGCAARTAGTEVSAQPPSRRCAGCRGSARR